MPVRNAKTAAYLFFFFLFFFIYRKEGREVRQFRASSKDSAFVSHTHTHTHTHTDAWKKGSKLCLLCFSSLPEFRYPLCVTYTRSREITLTAAKITGSGERTPTPQERMNNAHGKVVGGEGALHLLCKQMLLVHSPFEENDEPE